MLVQLRKQRKWGSKVNRIREEQRDFYDRQQRISEDFKAIV